MTCLYCGEPIDGELRLVNEGTGAVHIDCLFRMLAGGLNHLKGRCCCCGGSEPPDPPGMTKREAATAAADYYRGAGHG